jgi:hypothetical protein
MRVTPESGERSEGMGIPFPELARYLLARKKDSKMINTRVDSELHRVIEVLASEYGVTPATFNRYILAWVALGWKHGFVDVDCLSFTALESTTSARRKVFRDAIIQLGKRWVK